jgi:hypothetical protein
MLGPPRVAAAAASTLPFAAKTVESCQSLTTARPGMAGEVSLAYDAAGRPTRRRGRLRLLRRPGPGRLHCYTGHPVNFVDR